MKRQPAKQQPEVSGALPDEQRPAPKQQFWGARMTEAPEMSNVAYCAGRDVASRPMADAALVPFDLWQNRAHCAMLARQGIITKATQRGILRGLAEFEKRASRGTLVLDPRKEDVHTNIEHFVAEFSGPQFSGQMHIGRSRNDQTTTVMRLFTRQRLLEFGDAVSGLVAAVLSAADKYREIPIAGFTHYQPASVTTVGHWFASYAQFLMRDLSRIVAAYDRLNVSPLGAAASFGTSWPLDRAYTARLMGFDGVQSNSLDCITNRWEMEADAATAAEFTLTHLSIMSQDLIVLSAPQLAIVRVADRYVTGSSIMPQKRNPDFAEVTRAKATIVQNMTASLFGIARGALSGYNRDTQWTKYLIMDIFDEAADAPVVFTGVFDTLTVDAARAEQSAHENFVNAVDVADALARLSGLPFRQTYEIASRAVKLSEGQGSVDPRIVERLAAEAGVRGIRLRMGQPSEIVAAKRHDGGPAPIAVGRNIKEMQNQLGRARRELNARRRTVEAAQRLLREACR